MISHFIAQYKLFPVEKVPLSSPELPSSVADELLSQAVVLLKE